MVGGEQRIEVREGWEGGPGLERQLGKVSKDMPHDHLCELVATGPLCGHEDKWLRSVGCGLSLHTDGTVLLFFPQRAQLEFYQSRAAVTKITNGSLKQHGLLSQLWRGCHMQVAAGLVPSGGSGWVGSRPPPSLRLALALA